jgi:predicted nucleotidyltransferase component of viral defense system
MTILYSPAEKGFSARYDAIDRCQIALLREISGEMGDRLILKGGMAMRVAFGSMRLTKDLDFDRNNTIRQTTLKRGLERDLLRAANFAQIRESTVTITKDTSTTVRARVEGRIGDNEDARFEVEVSGRDRPSQRNIRLAIVTSPRSYAMAPFPVTTYTNEALAAMKIAAALSERRNAPRDLYDLRALMRSGADPTSLLASQGAQQLQGFADRALEKLEILSYALAQQELLPFLPPAERAALDEHEWLNATLEVAEGISTWCKKALQLQDTPSPKTPSP